jgi:hypothetical protein
VDDIGRKQHEPGALRSGVAAEGGRDEKEPKGQGNERGARTARAADRHRAGGAKADRAHHGDRRVAGGEEPHPDQRPGERSQGGQLAEPGREDLPHGVGFDRRPERRSRGGRALEDEREGAARDAGEYDRAQHEPGATGKARGRRRPVRIRAGRSAQGGSPGQSENDAGADPQPDRRVAEPARRPVGDRGRRARLAVLEQLGEVLCGARPRLADREHEAAGDGVRVGRDHPVGRGVGAVREARLEADGDGVTTPVRALELAAFHLLPPGVEDPDGAEARLNRLVEVEGDLPGLGVERRPSLGHGSLEDRVPVRGGRRAGEEEHRQAASSPDHQASLGPPASAARPARRRLMITIAAPASKASAPRPRNGAIGKPSCPPTQ